MFSGYITPSKYIYRINSTVYMMPSSFLDCHYVCSVDLMTLLLVQEFNSEADAQANLALNLRGEG